MQPIRTFNVSPALPKPLEPLRTLAYNLHWDWDAEARDLFRRLDRDLWESSRHNPVLLLGTISQQRLQEAAEDEGFLAQMERVVSHLDGYLKERIWYRKHRDPEVQPKDCYAYFSAEFGLTACMPIYSGGLGVLAGDHLKSASDLGLPLVGVGLLYQEGYFAQYLSADGWQQERYPINDFYNMPLHLERDAQGNELRIAVDYPGRQVFARIWRAQVGTVPLYLLDTNIEPNSPYDHDITDELYGGDLDVRIHQEIMLGIGGALALRALGLNPTAYHMNEGHSAFLTLERIRHLMQDEGLSYAQAQQVVVASSVFTTHTPVPAGFDLFPADKILYYLGQYAGAFGMSPEEFLSLGRENPGDLDSPFNMATLAMKMSSFLNGVSKLHGEVSRDMFNGLWSHLPKDEVPITAITNGVHARSCVAKATQELYERYLGHKWSSAEPDQPIWERVARIPDDELWRSQERCRAELVVFVRERMQKWMQQMSASPQEVARMQEILDPGVLTIGFSRRFATYKRATLFLRDVERIKRIVTGATSGRKVQFVIAGKAHPKDIPGKKMIQDIIHFIREHDMHDYIVFIPDYDINVARIMVSGCDVWLNNPRRPREASGTSGMKAAMNGLLNLSILDGWWDEADYVHTGWPIGHGEVYDDLDYQDQLEANTLYDLLEQEVVPLFYDRDEEGIPRGWVAKMKNAIRFNLPTFNTARMVRDYAMQAYFPASDRCYRMLSDNYAAAKELAAWKTRLFEHWYDIRIVDVDVSEAAEIQVSQNISVKARLRLGALTSSDVRVELYVGAIDADGNITNGTPMGMEHQGQDTEGNSVYTGNVTYGTSGLQGFSLRVLPQHEFLSSPYEPKLVLWASPMGS